MEKIIVNPKGVRGLGNIVKPTTYMNYGEYNSNIGGYTSPTYGYVYNMSVITGSYLTLSYNKLMTSTGNLTVTATLKQSSDNSVITGSIVRCYYNNDSYTATTNSSGVATFTLPVTREGEHTFKVIWNGVHNSISGCIRTGEFHCGTIDNIETYSTKQYFLKGTTTTLLSDTNPNLEGATITFKKNNTTLGTGTTTRDGVAAYTYTGTGAGEIDITSTITINGETTTSEPVTVYDCRFLDPGTDTTTATYYNYSSRATITTDTGGKTIKNTSGSTATVYCIPPGETSGAGYLYTTPFTIELDFAEYDGTSYLQLSNGTTNFFRSWQNLAVNGGEHIRMVIGTTSQAIYIDESETAKYTATNNFSNVYVRFNVANNASVKFKDLKIYPTGE